MWITELTTKTKTADTRIGNQSARIPVMPGMQACGRRQTRVERTSRPRSGRGGPCRLQPAARRDSFAPAMRHLALALSAAAPFAAAQQQQTAPEPAPQPAPPAAA